MSLQRIRCGRPKRVGSYRSQLGGPCIPGSAWLPLPPAPVPWLPTPSTEMALGTEMAHMAPFACWPRGPLSLTLALLPVLLLLLLLLASHPKLLLPQQSWAVLCPGPGPRGGILTPDNTLKKLQNTQVPEPRSRATVVRNAKEQKPRACSFHSRARSARSWPREGSLRTSVGIERNPQCSSEHLRARGKGLTSRPLTVRLGKERPDQHCCLRPRAWPGGTH